MKAARLSRFSCLLSAFLIVGVGDAAELMPSKEQIIDWVRADEFAKLQAYLVPLQREYGQGKITDETLRDEYRPFFYESSPDLESHYGKWITQYPKSYPARLARGLYYSAIADKARGTGFIRDTSAENLRTMEREFAKALVDINASYSLDDHPVLSYARALDISMGLGEKQETRRVFDRGLRIAPKSYLLRLKFMSSLQPRWGGSIEEMSNFLVEARSADLPARVVNELHSMVLQEEARELKSQGSLKAAAQKYEEAAKFTSTSECDECGPLMRGGSAYLAAGEYAEAVRVFTKVLDQSPESVGALRGRGTAYLYLRKGHEGVRDLTIAAEKGDNESLHNLAMVYLQGQLVVRDQNAGFAYLRRAASAGFAPSKDLLRRYGQN